MAWSGPPSRKNAPRVTRCEMAGHRRGVFASLACYHRAGIGKPATLCTSRASVIAWRRAEFVHASCGQCGQPSRAPKNCQSGNSRAAPGSATAHPPTGSDTIANTIGIVDVARLSAAVVGVPFVKIAAGANRTSSWAWISIRSAMPSVHRISIRRFCPSFQPSTPSSVRKACNRPCNSASVSRALNRSAICRTRSGCCASPPAATLPPRRREPR